MYKERFLQHLKFEKRYSPHTVSAYEMEINVFLAFVNAERQDFAGIDARFVRYFLSILKEQGRQATSINRTISSLRSYYKFLEREGLVDSNPVQAIKALRKPKKLPTVIATPALVLAQEDREEIGLDSFSDYRDFIIIELLFGTGIRLAELLTIKERDIDFFDEKMLILGKRSKQRFVPIHTKLRQHLQTYINLKKATFLENNLENLLVTNTGKPAYAKLVYRVVHSFLSTITSQKKRSPHVLRHTFATSLLDEGADLNAIKEILGHAGLVATQVYTHNSAERLKSIYKQAHPKA